MRVLTKIAAAVGHLILSPLLVVLLLRRRWLMVPIIAEAILRGVLVGVVLILVVVLMLMVGQLGVVQAMLTMLAVLKVMALMGGGHGIVHVAAAIQIGIRIARRWWGGHYTGTRPPSTTHYRSSTTTVSTAVGHHWHGQLLLNGGQCGVAAEIVTMPFAGKSGQSGWCAGGLGGTTYSHSPTVAVAGGRGSGLHFRLLSGQIREPGT